MVKRRNINTWADEYSFAAHSGFTIPELLIAMAVFSFVLTLSTIGFIQIAQMYQRGITTQNVQDTTRYLTEDMVRTLRASDHIRVETLGSTEVICSDDYRYFLGSNGEDNDALYKQAIEQDEEAETTCLPSSGGGLDTGGANTSQMTGNDLVVREFSVNPFNKLQDGSGYYSAEISLGVSTATEGLFNEDTDQCDPSQPGSHFCAVSSQVTTVTTRGAM